MFIIVIRRVGLDYKDFIPRDEAYKSFLKYRKEVMDAADEGDFGGAFADVCEKAIEGDAVAQDVLAYFYNKGFDDFQPNFENYMSWEILAGANGNEFALEKLQFFLDVGLNTIIYDDEVLKRAMIRGNVTKENAIPMISNLICEGMVDELGLDPKNLVSINHDASEYTPAKNRVFVNAMENCLYRVIEFLMS